MATRIITFIVEVEVDSEVKIPETEITRLLNLMEDQANRWSFTEGIYDNRTEDENEG